MKLPDAIKRPLIKLVISKSGPYLQQGIAAAAAVGASYLSTKAPWVAEAGIDQATLVALAWGLTNIILTSLATGPLKEYGAQIQAVLNKHGAGLKLDGYVGPKTVEAAKQTLNNP